jgi:hypothetical protein
MGLFGVNMPLLYGEGEKAFIRLQEEILRLEEDNTLLTWNDSAHVVENCRGLLAKSPENFNFESSIYRNLKRSTILLTSASLATTAQHSSDREPHLLTPRGLRTSFPIFELGNDAHIQTILGSQWTGKRIFLAFLGLEIEDVHGLRLVCLALSSTHGTGKLYVWESGVVFIEQNILRDMGIYRFREQVRYLDINSPGSYDTKNFGWSSISVRNEDSTSSYPVYIEGSAANEFDLFDLEEGPTTLIFLFKYQSHYLHVRCGVNTTELKTTPWCTIHPFHNSMSSPQRATALLNFADNALDRQDLPKSDLSWIKLKTGIGVGWTSNASLSRRTTMMEVIQDAHISNQRTYWM